MVLNRDEAMAGHGYRNSCLVTFDFLSETINGNYNLVALGGGLKCAFAAGVLYEMSEQQGVRPVWAAGCGASATTMAYFVANQHDEYRNIWMSHLGNSAFLNPTGVVTRKPLFNVPWLVEEIFNKKVPMNVEAILGSKTEYSIATFDYRKGMPRCFSNKTNLTDKNFFDAMQATLTIHKKHLAEEEEFSNLVDIDLDPYAVFRYGLVPQKRPTVFVSNHRQDKLGFDVGKHLASIYLTTYARRNHPPEVNRYLAKRRELATSGIEAAEKFVADTGSVVIAPSQKTRHRRRGLFRSTNGDMRSLFEQGRKAFEDKLQDPDLKRILSRF